MSKAAFYSGIVVVTVGLQLISLPSAAAAGSGKSNVQLLENDMVIRVHQLSPRQLRTATASKGLVHVSAYHRKDDDQDQTFFVRLHPLAINR